MFESMFPILATPDLARALSFWRDLVGGVVEYQFPPEGPPVYVGLEVGSSHLGIGEDTSAVPSGPSPISLWVYVVDCDAAFARLRDGGAEVVEAPAEQPWGERVARVRDPDGNLVIIGQRS